VRSIAALGALLLALAACSSDETAEPDTTATIPVTGETAPEETETGAAPGPLRLSLVRVAAGLEAPTHVAAAPGEPDRVYIVDQPGRILVLRGGRLLRRPFLDIVPLVRSGGEQGLLSVAFHPGYEENRLFYVNYTDLQGHTNVVEYEATGDPPKRRRELLFVEQPYANHNGGQLAFGPDGLLYVGMGDGGSAGDPENRAQDLSSQLGKLLRYDVDAPGRQDWEMVAYGLRNPWRFSFDRETGDLWIGDVGQGEIEEIDYLPRGTGGLVNFGWDVLEGTRTYEDKEPDPSGELIDPVAQYTHDEGCSITGGFVYRGNAVPAAQGRYFYGDYCSGFVWSLELRDGRARDIRRHNFEVNGLASFGEDAAGELYLVSLTGSVYRLAPA
jgi:glucose/arabinose dehydrogenase